MELTERQQQVVDLRHGSDPPLSFKEIGHRLNISRTYAHQVYHRACEKLEKAKLDPSAPNVGGHNALERQDPEKAAEVMDALTDPFRRSIAQVARECGVNYDVARRLERRLATQFLPLERAVGEVKRTELRELFAQTDWRVLTRITDEDIERAPLRDKMVAAGIAIDKMRALDDEPTEVYSAAELANLEELSGLLLREVKRRGISIDPDSTANDGHKK